MTERERTLRTLAHLRALRDLGTIEPLTVASMPGLADALSMPGLDWEDPDALSPVKAPAAPTPAPERYEHVRDIVEALDAAAGLIAPTRTRSFAAHDGFNWKTDRGRHEHHHVAHAIGQLLAHAVILGGRGLGKIVPHHVRRVLAHAAHGFAQAVHPHPEE